MKNFRRFFQPGVAALTVVVAGLAGGAAGALLGLCGPFTDVTDPSFCGNLLEVYYLGITTGMTPTTYSPSDPVNRLQMAIFLSRSADRLLQRAGRRAALEQFWTTKDAQGLSVTTIGATPFLVETDGVDLWVTSAPDGTVTRVRASDGRLLETWTGAASATGVLSAMGKIFVTGNVGGPGRLYRIDPAQAAGAVTTVATNIGGVTGGNPWGIGFDGSKIWTANGSGSVSIVTPGLSPPWTVTTVTTGFSSPRGGFVWDGAHMWVTDAFGQSLLKLDGAGAILQTVTVGSYPLFPVFDGENIWVPNDFDNSLSVVRASTGAVLATLTGNGILGPGLAAFDGQRVLVTTNNNSVSLWKAADLSPLGSVSTGPNTAPFGACSDGISFWLALSFSNQLARF
jgi:hypothetical protein